MSTRRRFKFDLGDWIAVRDRQGMWRLGGKVIAADPESVTVERRDRAIPGVPIRSRYVVGEDVIARVRWLPGGRWATC